MSYRNVLLFLAAVILVTVLSCEAGAGSPGPVVVPENPVVPEVPLPPADLEADAITGATIKLTWSDNSDNEEGFTLQRAVNSSFTGATEIAVPADAIDSLDTGLAAGHTYYYRLRAGSSVFCETGPVKTPDAATDTVVKVNFIDGIEHGGQKIYTIWLANPGQNFYRNISVCDRIKKQNLTGTGLPYWQENVRPHFTSSEIDAVSGPTVVTGNFTREITLDQNAPRQFTVYFEVDHSWDDNDWFSDQPAVLFAADVDLDNPRTSYTMHFIGWTPNENTDGGEPGGIYGVLNTVLEYILKLKTAAGGFGGDEPEPATDQVGALTVTIER